METEKKYACRCCGFLTLEEEPCGSWEICPVCFWEDDQVQIEEPTWTGANRVTIGEAKENFLKFGACEARLKPLTRKPYPCEYF